MKNIKQKALNIAGGIVLSLAVATGASAGAQRVPLKHLEFQKTSCQYRINPKGEKQINSCDYALDVDGDGLADLNVHVELDSKDNAKSKAFIGGNSAINIYRWDAERKYWVPYSE